LGFRVQGGGGRLSLGGDGRLFGLEGVSAEYESA
jgi:hypothetical protein